MTKHALIIATVFFLLSFGIESSENNPVTYAMQNGQCNRIENVLQCESKDFSVSVQFKTSTQP
mgnify:CR=1 FL=1